MTVLEVIQRSAEFLAQKGVDSPRLQIELMLAHTLKLPRLQLYLNFQRDLAEPELAAVREMVKRRGQREPLQHVLGSTSFCGLEIVCSRAALVPRPETELLAERGWRFLSSVTPPPATALDFGTGTGCVALALAQGAPGAEIHGLEVSATALELAKQNAERNRLGGRIHFHAGDGFQALPPGLTFHLIISNPPYIPSAEIETLQPEVRDYDPRSALDGGPDGLDFYRRFADQAGPFLKSGGRLMLEFGDEQETALKNLFESQKWIVEEIVADYSARPRILIARHG